MNGWKLFDRATLAFNRRFDRALDQVVRPKPKPKPKLQNC
jgi:hypothetical protein